MSGRRHRIALVCGGLMLLWLSVVPGWAGFEEESAPTKAATMPRPYVSGCHWRSRAMLRPNAFSVTCTPGDRASPWTTGKRYSGGQRAAAQGNARAQAGLGSAYSLGYGVLQDDRQAFFQWSQRAAEGRCPRTNYARCAIRSREKADPQDYTWAFQWYHKAAAQGDPLAQVDLGALYAKGKGVPRVQPSGTVVATGCCPGKLRDTQDDLGSMYSKGWGGTAG